MVLPFKNYWLFNYAFANKKPFLNTQHLLGFQTVFSILDWLHKLLSYTEGLPLSFEAIDMVLAHQSNWIWIWISLHRPRNQSPIIFLGEEERRREQKLAPPKNIWSWSVTSTNWTHASRRSAKWMVSLRKGESISLFCHNGMLWICLPGSTCIGTYHGVRFKSYWNLFVNSE